MKVQPLTVAVPPLSRPPPMLAELPVKVLSLTVAVPTFFEAAAIGAGGVAGEGAGSDRDRPAVVEAAAVEGAGGAGVAAGDG